MSKNVAGRAAPVPPPSRPREVTHHSDTTGLYTATGRRKYLSNSERGRVLTAVASQPPETRLFVLLLAWTGARISEVLALCRASLLIDEGVVAFRTLKRRRFHIREVPIPPDLMRELTQHFEITRAQAGGDEVHDRLWRCDRTTAWRTVKRIMAAADVRGPQATPRGLRHAFGIGALQAGVPINLVQRWLGHARLSTTAIYANATGPEEQAFAARFWDAGR